MPKIKIDSSSLRFGGEIELEYETVDAITVANLKEYRDRLRQELDGASNGDYIHPEDEVHAKKMIDAIDFVVKDFEV